MADMGYDTDFYRWTQPQDAHLRAKEWPALDVDNLAEEIESLGASDRRALRRHLMRLSQHLLKWCYQPQRRGEGGQQSIGNTRLQIELILEDSPSLQEFLPEAFAWAYPRGRQEASKDTGLPLATFPETKLFADSPLICILSPTGGEDTDEGAYTCNRSITYAKLNHWVMVSRFHGGVALS